MLNDERWGLDSVALALSGRQVDDNASYTILSMEEIKMETPHESREADEKPNSMEDSLKEAMERMRRKHAMRTAGLLDTNDSAPPAEDDAVSIFVSMC